MAGWFTLPLAGYGQEVRRIPLRDITTVLGIRDNQLIGYGIVVGLRGTGDRQQTLFTTQTVASAMQRMGITVPGSAIRINNTAAVFVTASLPPFSRAGMRLDVTASSVGDAKSLEGGVLLMTALRAADGQVYAEAQGPVTLGGYNAGFGTTAKIVNHTTVGSVAGGAIVERDVSVDLNSLPTISLMLRNPDFATAQDAAKAINSEFGKEIATAVDSRQIDINVARAEMSTPSALISRVQSLAVQVHSPAKVVINERTGTIVMGGDVTLSPVSVLHGNLTIEVSTNFSVSQPNPLSKGETVTTPSTELSARDSTVKTIRMEQGANVQELINGLQAIGATARDIVAILQAIKAAGGLQAELEIL